MTEVIKPMKNILQVLSIGRVELYMCQCNEELQGFYV